MHQLRIRLLILWIAIAALAARELLSLGADAERVERQAESQLRTLSLAFAGLVGSSLQSADANLRAARETLPDWVPVAQHLTPSRLDEISQLLTRYQKRTPGMVALMLTDANGQVIAAAGSATDATVADRAYFRALRNPRSGASLGMMVSQVLVSRLSGVLGLQVAHRISRPDGRFAGVLVATLDVDAHFGAFYRALRTTPSMAFALLDEDHRLLMRLPHGDDFIGRQARLRPGEAIVHSASGEQLFQDIAALEGNTRMVMLQPIVGYPLRAFASERRDLIMAPYQASRNRSVLYLLLLATAGSLLSILLWRVNHQDARTQLYAKVFSLAREGILITDTNSVIIDVNQRMQEMTGYTRDELIGQKPQLLKSGRQNAEFYNQFWESLQHQGQWRGELWNRRKNGDLYAQTASVSSVRDAQGHLTHYIALCTDITALKSQAEVLDEKAHHDNLTGLPNRALFDDRLRLALARAQRDRRQLAVCYLDLDEFKPINDNYGHAAGDLVLVEIAKRLKSLVRGSDTIARLGGDEFVIILNDLSSVDECRQAVERLLAVVSAPVALETASVAVSASIGIALYPRDGTDAQELMLLADQAMYEAKRSGRNRYSEYG